MSRPTDVGSYGESLYEQLLPLAWDDENQDWALLIFMGGFGAMVQDLSDLISDTDEDDTDRPGWANLLDVEVCPEKHLPYLAQFVGARVTPGAAEEDARNEVRTPIGQQRGTPAAIIAAAQRRLTDTKTVYFTERVDGNAYWMEVATLVSETPYEDLTRADILSQKPGGIRLDYFTTTDVYIDDLDGTIDALVGSIDGL